MISNEFVIDIVALHRADWHRSFQHKWEPYFSMWPWRSKRWYFHQDIIHQYETIAKEFQKTQNNTLQRRLDLLDDHVARMMC